MVPVVREAGVIDTGGNRDLIAAGSVRGRRSDHHGRIEIADEADLGPIVSALARAEERRLARDLDQRRISGRHDQIPSPHRHGGRHRHARGVGGPIAGPERDHVEGALRNAGDQEGAVGRRDALECGRRDHHHGTAGRHRSTGLLLQQDATLQRTVLAEPDLVEIDDLPVDQDLERRQPPDRGREHARLERLADVEIDVPADREALQHETAVGIRADPRVRPQLADQRPRHARQIAAGQALLDDDALDEAALARRWKVLGIADTGSEDEPEESAADAHGASYHRCAQTGTPSVSR